MLLHSVHVLNMNESLFFFVCFLFFFILISISLALHGFCFSQLGQCVQHDLAHNVKMNANSSGIHVTIWFNLCHGHIHHTTTKATKPKQTAYPLHTKSHRKLIRSNGKIRSFNSHYLNLNIPLFLCLSFSLSSHRFHFLFSFGKDRDCFYVCINSNECRRKHNSY